MFTLKHLLILLPLIIISQSVHAQSGTVQWQPCTNSQFDNWFEDEPPEALLCSYVDAPLTYSVDAKADKVRLALTRLPATGVKKGSVVVISGGPGLPGINPFMSDDDTVAKLTQSYDIVGYDPRGVGQSTPKISCGVPGRERPVIDEHDISASEAQARKTLAACIKHTGLETLKHMGSDDAVNDLNVIRAALGEPVLTAVAYSYGTQIAALYAERFPQQTRALVLDGVVDLSEDDFTQQLNQARGYQQTFQRFAAFCAKHPDCPLPGDEAGAVEAFHGILRTLPVRTAAINRAAQTHSPCPSTVRCPGASGRTSATTTATARKNQIPPAALGCAAPQLKLWRSAATTPSSISSPYSFEKMKHHAIGTTRDDGNNVLKPCPG